MGVNATQDLQRAQHRDPGADHGRHPARQHARPTCCRPGLGHRRLGHGQPPQVADPRHRRPGRPTATAPGSRSRGWATRCSTRSSCRWPRRTSGTCGPDGRQAATRSTSTSPELAKLLPVLYPGVFPNLAKYTKARADLIAILLTGIPNGVVPGFQNYTGPVEADMLRLNVAVPPTPEPQPAGPGGRRPGRLPQRAPGHRRHDDRRAAGHRRPDDPAGRPDLHAGRRGQGDQGRHDERQPSPTWTSFPYLGTPNGGYQTTPGTSSA